MTMPDGRQRSSTGDDPAGRRLTADGFAGCFDAAFRELWCIAVAIVSDRHLADDVMQEAAIVALGKLERFDPATSFLAWMGQIVRYTALNHGRKRMRTRTHTIDDASPRAADACLDRGVAGSGELDADQSAFDDRVVTALSTLDPTARACLLLRTIIDLPYRDISLALDIPEGTAMSHVHRSRRALRELLSTTHAGVSDG